MSISILKDMHVAVIGGGPAGLAAARHLTAHGDEFTCTVFEQTGSTGGTWVYTDQVGADEFGLPIHTSMYKSLKTNLPKQSMSYPDFPIIADDDYVSAQELLKYFDNYKNHFKLEEYVKYFHHVKCVSPSKDGWDVRVIDLKSQNEETFKFDAVMVCNGHYSLPHVPELPGAKIFRGEQIHSHDYRTPDRFRDKTVLVIGAGFSARDISLEISSVARKVILSHHLKAPITNIDFPPSTVQKPDIDTLSEDTVRFEDGSVEDVDIILYCTGYLYDFHYLSKDCLITVDDNYVQPLYKHLINIEHPTMCLIGIPLYVSPLAMFDVQVQYFLKTLDGSIRLPSRDEMLAETESEMKIRRAVEGFTNRKAHKMGTLQEAYCNELSDLIGIPRLPDIVFKRFNQSLCALTK